MADLSPPSIPPSEKTEESPPKKFARSYVACRRCHSHKVKCSGETPCRNCVQSKHPTECIYPVRDRKITIPESYLKRLEAENRDLKRKRSPEPSLHAPPSPDVSAIQNEASPSVDQPVMPSGQLFGTTTDEGNKSIPDESSIQPMYIGEAACTTFGNRLRQFLTGAEKPPPPRPHDVYYKNPKLHRMSNGEFQLPNRNYAKLLVRAFLRFVGPDYHLLLRKSFLERLDETYRLKMLDDPVWLCRLFVVFALGELYSTRATRTNTGPGVPGTAFFLKAMGLFQDLYEEPTLSYIETLLLLSFYSHALNRRNTAYTYAGLALRLSLTLGLHRRVPDDSSLTPTEREHRVRVWWTLYALDRMYSSKVGHPVMLRDEDIDVQLPSMEGLRADEREDFYEPESINAHIKLARITGNIMSDIYRIPKPGRANTFVQSVQRILTDLRSWHETLPNSLKLDFHATPIYSSRTVASLHLHFGQCVILTTRPIFFHLFKTRFQTSATATTARNPSLMTASLAEACIQAARTSNSILAQLWVDGWLATFGFFDALSVFSTTLILMMSSSLRSTDTHSDDDAVETAWSLLRSMRDDGNVPARSYYQQLVELKTDIERLQQKTKIMSAATAPGPQEANGLQMLLAASGSYQNHRSQPALGNTSLVHTPTGDALGVPAILDDPFLQDFLAQSGPLGSWAAEFEMDTNQWSFDWEDANLFGTI